MIYNSGKKEFLILAARLGFEPRLRDSESPVLPLYDLAILNLLGDYSTPFAFRKRLVFFIALILLSRLIASLFSLNVSV